MKIQVLCSDPKHAVTPYLEKWCQKWSKSYEVELLTDSSLLMGGDLLFLISATEIIGIDVLNLYDSALVIHASDLPSGRGWSPLTWQILEGKREIVLSMFEAAEIVDSGDIWKKSVIGIPENSLFEEIVKTSALGTLELMDFAVENYSNVTAKAQVGEPTYYRRRILQDSKVSHNQTIEEIFDLVRVCDPVRYPAHFSFRDRTYKIKFELMGEIE